MKDTFRQTYKELDGLTKDNIFVIKKIAENLEKEFDLIEVQQDVDRRCLEIARTNLEQCVMWAIKSIT